MEKVVPFFITDIACGGNTMAKSYEINFTKGAMIKPLLLFALPLMLSGMLQLFYNAADIIVVGRFAGKESLAAVGATSSLINLLTNAFLGLSVGANVLISKGFGINDKSLIERTVHTAVALSLLGGVIFGVIGFVFAEPILELMDTPEDVISKSAVYMRIYFAGLPAVALYNFGAAILRAVGDTKRPLFFLIISGFINIVLNLVFVIIFKMDVAGVALATIISQICSAVMTAVCIAKADGAYKLHIKKIRICSAELVQILKIGLPAGVQGTLFSLSNVLIQSSINSFGAVAVAGNSAGANLEGFVYIAMNSVHHTALTFCAQNLGAENYKRIKKGVYYCIGLVSFIGLIFGNLVVLFSHNLLSVYSSEPEVIEVGMQRISVICSMYFLCGIMDVLAGVIRGLSYSVMPMIISLIGACGLRVLWIYIIFEFKRSLMMLYIAYPVSWFLTAAALWCVYCIIIRKIACGAKMQKI